MPSKTDSDRNQQLMSLFRDFFLLRRNEIFIIYFFWDRKKLKRFVPYKKDNRKNKTNDLHCFMNHDFYFPDGVVVKIK